ncbi:MAG: murein peptide amidase A, partial [Bdellovibrio sp.]
MQGKIFHQSSWARTSQGTPIELYKKTHTHSPAPILFIGGVHGDEPEGVRLAQDLLLWLQQAETSLAASLRSWILIPCIN